MRSFGRARGAKRRRSDGLKGDEPLPSVAAAALADQQLKASCGLYCRDGIAGSCVVASCRPPGTKRLTIKGRIPAH
jgi:hypothetical protein